VIVAETLPDMTADQVIDEIKSDDRLSGAPIAIEAKNAEEATQRFGDKIAGVISGSDMKAIEAVMAKGLGGDRALADDLSMRAASVLSRLAHTDRNDLTPIIPQLTSTLATRPDGVIIPAMNALGAAGGAAQTGPLIAVLVDEKHSDDARVAAARAVADILARDPNAVAADAMAQVQAVVSSKASIAVRSAAAYSLGLMNLDPAQRAELMHRLNNGGESVPASEKK